MLIYSTRKYVIITVFKDSVVVLLYIYIILHLIIANILCDELDYVSFVKSANINWKVVITVVFD